MRTKRKLEVENLERREVFSANGLAECAAFQLDPSSQANAIFADGFESGNWFDGSDVGFGYDSAASSEYQDGDDLFLPGVADTGTTQLIACVFDSDNVLNANQFVGEASDGNDWFMGQDWNRFVGDTADGVDWFMRQDWNQLIGESADCGALTNSQSVLDDTAGAETVQIQSCNSGLDIRDRVMAMIGSGDVKFNWERINSLTSMGEGESCGI